MTSEKHLSTQNQDKNIVQLHNNGLRAGSLLDASLSRLSREQEQNLLAKAGEEALRLQAKSAEQNMDYVAGKKAAEDHIEIFNMLDRDGKTTRQSVTSEIKTGAGTMRIESKSGATCFVASVVYDDQNHPDVLFLRCFRDEVLRKSKKGQSFISWYWKKGPKIAKFVGNYYCLRKIARLLISGLVISLKKVSPLLNRK